MEIRATAAAAVNERGIGASRSRAGRRGNDATGKRAMLWGAEVSRVDCDGVRTKLPRAGPRIKERGRGVTV